MFFIKLNVIITESMSHADQMLGVELGVANIDISSTDLRLFT